MKLAALVLTLVLSLSSTALWAGPSRKYTFVYILTGPTTDLDAKASNEAFAGHFSNMKRMAEEDGLLVAGPYGTPRSDADLRGLWIFETEDTEKALELAATDPPGKLGLFVFDAVELRTDDALMELPRLEKEAEQRRLADPEIPDEWSGRGYILATAPTSACDEPERAQGVLLLATLVGHEGSRIEEDHWLVLLDATTPGQAERVLTKAGCDPEQWSLDGWYSSTTHTELPALRE